MCSCPLTFSAVHVVSSLLICGLGVTGCIQGALEPGEVSGEPRALNEQGQVVGMTNIQLNAFIWERDQGMEDFGVLPDDQLARPVDVNDHGMFVGQGEPSWEIFVGESGGDLVALQFRQLLPGGFVTASPADINNQGEVTGWADWEQLNEYDFESGRVAFIWNATDGARSLGNLGGMSTTPTAMNNVGQVVGYGSTSDSGVIRRAFLWDNEEEIRELLADSEYASSVDSSALAINDAGMVVGRIDSSQVFVWDEVNGVQLMKPTYTFAGPRGLNENGQVLLSEYTATIIWSPGGEEIRIEGMSGVALTNNGEVAGAREEKAYLWSPERGLQEVGDVGSRQVYNVFWNSYYTEYGGVIDMNEIGQILIYNRRSSLGARRAFALIEP